jgi:protease IV
MRFGMHSGSFFKDLLRKIFFSFFGAFAFGIGLLAVILVFSAVLKKPPQANHTTECTVLANADWKQTTLSKTAPTIVQVNIKGVIGMDELVFDDIRTQFIDTVDGQIKIGQVKGIILCLDTPGGTVSDSDAIYRLVKQYKERYKVPVWAFVDGMCASGGMYIASSADKVFATPASLVGHVGVLMGPMINVSELMNNLGVKSKTLTAGKDKDALNPFRPWQPGEEAPFQAICDYYYTRFITIVSTSRPKLTKESLIEQGAHVYPAPEAEALGYIDEQVDNIDTLVRRFTKELACEKEYQLVTMKTENWLEDLFKGNLALFNGKVEHTIKIGTLPANFSGKMLYLYCPELNTR